VVRYAAHCVKRPCDVLAAQGKNVGLIIDYFEGESLEDLEDLNYHNIRTHVWPKFYQNDNTFQELINSENLGIISNDAIKNSLMNLHLRYKKMKSEEDLGPHQSGHRRPVGFREYNARCRRLRVIIDRSRPPRPAT